MKPLNQQRAKIGLQRFAWSSYFGQKSIFKFNTNSLSNVWINILIEMNSKQRNEIMSNLKQYFQRISEPFLTKSYYNAAKLHGHISDLQMNSKDILKTQSTCWFVASIINQRYIECDTLLQNINYTFPGRSAKIHIRGVIKEFYIALNTLSFCSDLIQESLEIYKTSEPVFKKLELKLLRFRNMNQQLSEKNDEYTSFSSRKL